MSARKREDPLHKERSNNLTENLAGHGNPSGYQRRTKKKVRIIKNNYVLPNILEVLSDDTHGIIGSSLAVNLQRCVRMLDLVYLTLFLESHPYYSGTFLKREFVLAAMLIGAAAAYIITVVIVIALFQKPSLFVTQAILLVSIVLYPLSGTLLKSLSYLEAHEILGIFAFLEFLKFLGMFTVEEMMEKRIEEVKGDKCEESFRAIGMMIRSLILGVGFALLGPLMTLIFSLDMLRSDGDNKGGDLVYWNWLFSFLPLGLVLLAALVIATMAGKMAEEKEENKKYDDFEDEDDSNLNKGFNPNR